MTHSILKTAQAWNKANGIKGVLCQEPGVFLQARKGERGSVTRLYSRIYAGQHPPQVEMIALCRQAAIDGAGADRHQRRRAINRYGNRTFYPARPASSASCNSTSARVSLWFGSI
jgi:hypothetical protein